MVGPMTTEQLLSYSITENTQVSTDGVNWKPLYQFPDLVSSLTNNPNYKSEMGSKKTICGIMAILFGALGIQYFLLNNTKAGIITILISIVTCGLWGIVMFIQGIMMLTMSQEDFVRKYVDNTSTYPLF